MQWNGVVTTKTLHQQPQRIVRFYCRKTTRAQGWQGKGGGHPSCQKRLWVAGWSEGGILFQGKRNHIQPLPPPPSLAVDIRPALIELLMDEV